MEIFEVFWGFEVMGLCWVYGATACFCNGFWWFVKNGFFGEIDFFVCFDIYVWGWKFCFVLVCVKWLKKWFIILGFLGKSGWIIWLKCKDFDSNFGSVWRLGKIFGKVLVWGGGAGLMVQRRGGRSAFWFFLGNFVECVDVEKNFFFLGGNFSWWKIFWEKFLGQLVIFGKILENGGEVGNFLLYR